MSTFPLAIGAIMFSVGLVVVAFAALAPAGQPKVKIRLLTPLTNERLTNMLKDILRNLNDATDKSYVIEHEQIDPTLYWETLQERMANNSDLDLMWMTPGWVPHLAEAGFLEKITDLLEKSASEDAHPAANRDDYLQPALHGFTYQDEIYGLPWNAIPLMLFVNEDHVGEAGLEKNINEWDWNEFRKASEILTRDESGISADRSGFNYSSIERFGFGGSGYRYLAVPGIPPLRIESDQTQKEYMEKGAVSMVMDWASVDYEAQGQTSFDEFLVPKGPGASREIPAKIFGVGISSSTKNRDLAFQALLDLSQALQDADAFPARRSMISLDRIKNSSPSITDTSAQNILESIFQISSPVGEPYPMDNPGPDIIGNADLVPNDPLMLEAIGALATVLAESSVAINVARTVVMHEGTSKEHFETTHLAPVVQGFLHGRPDTNSLDLIIGVVLIESAGADGGIPPGPYAVRVAGSQDNPMVELVGPDRSVRSVDTSPPEVNEFGPIPTAGIFLGSKTCRCRILGITIVHRCGWLSLLG